jgi:DNA-binding transcriptional ArsR family regulator
MMEISIPKMERACEEVCLILKALSHPQRLLVMGHLFKGPKTVSELVDLCGISQSHMSQFLMRMGSEGLVKSERQGKFKLYSVADHRLIELMKTIQAQYCRR